MKKFIIATAILLATAATANAGCGTNSLNGVWRYQNLASASSVDVTILNGLFGGVLPITQGKNSCRITLVSGGTTYHGRSDNVSGTDRKPMMIMFSADAAGSSMYTMVRQ